MLTASRPLPHCPATACHPGAALAAEAGDALHPAPTRGSRERRRQECDRCRRAGEDFDGYSDSSADAVADSFAEATLGLDVGPAAAVSARFCRLNSALRGPFGWLLRGCGSHPRQRSGMKVPPCVVVPPEDESLEHV